jgi:hypothetical protein
MEPIVHSYSARPHPVVYLVILAIGYYEGMHSSGGWSGFLLIAVVFTITLLALKLAKYLWRAI